MSSLFVTGASREEPRGGTTGSLIVRKSHDMLSKSRDLKKTSRTRSSDVRMYIETKTWNICSA